VHAGVEGERPIGRPVDQIVDIALHQADVLEARSAVGKAREHEAAVSPTRGAQARPNADLSKSAAQPSGTGTVTSLPSVS
jgi:hypothetical protein